MRAAMKNSCNFIPWSNNMLAHLLPVLNLLCGLVIIFNTEPISLLFYLGVLNILIIPCYYYKI